MLGAQLPASALASSEARMAGIGMLTSIPAVGGGSGWAREVDDDEDRRYGKNKRGDELPEELAFRKGRLRKIREAKAPLGTTKSRAGSWAAGFSRENPDMSIRTTRELLP